MESVNEVVRKKLEAYPKPESQLALRAIELAERYGNDASVAEQLMTRDAMAAHTRDELGISINSSARPIQAALASAATFSVGAAMPLLIVFLSPETKLIPFVFGTTLVFLAGLGVLAALAGGAPIVRAAVRVMFWGALAMALTAAVGALFRTLF